MSIRIKEAVGRRALRTFIQIPFAIYRDNAYWVPPLLSDEKRTLRKDRNPAFEYAEAAYWIAYKDGVPAGRIAGIINPLANEKWNHKLARFGWVEFIEDFSVARALFETAENWALDRGMTGIQGPLGFTDLDPEGMLIDGFEEMGTLPMIYNHSYYPEFLERLGYTKDIDWVEYEITCPDEIPERIKRIHAMVLQRSGCRIADISTRKQLIRRYGKAVFALLDEAYSELYGTVPLTEKQINAYISQYLGFIDLRFTKIVVNEDDAVVGVGIAMPSLSKALQKCRGRLFPFGWHHLLKALRNPEGLDLYLIGIKKEYRNRGLNSLLLTEITQNAILAGIRTAESSGELETNHAVQSIWKHFPRRQHKRRRAYIKMLSDTAGRNSRQKQQSMREKKPYPGLQ